MIDTSIFPHAKFPYRLDYVDDKKNTVCFFSCNEHLEKYISRYNLNKKDLNIRYCKEVENMKVDVGISTSKTKKPTSKKITPNKKSTKPRKPRVKKEK